MPQVSSLKILVSSSFNPQLSLNQVFCGDYITKNQWHKIYVTDCIKSFYSTFANASLDGGSTKSALPWRIETCELRSRGSLVKTGVLEDHILETMQFNDAMHL